MGYIHDRYPYSSRQRFSCPALTMLEVEELRVILIVSSIASSVRLTGPSSLSQYDESKWPCEVVFRRPQYLDYILFFLLAAAASMLEVPNPIPATKKSLHHRFYWSKARSIVSQNLSTYIVMYINIFHNCLITRIRYQSNGNLHRTCALISCSPPFISPPTRVWTSDLDALGLVTHFIFTLPHRQASPYNGWFS